MTPSVYFFDMDHTLINNDCDVSWKEFLVAQGIAPKDALQEADAFFEQYKRGALDVPAFLAFQLREFIGKSAEEMATVCLEHFNVVVRPRIYKAGKLEVEKAQRSGCRTVLLTATNNVIAKPLADYLGIENLEATNLEMTGGLYTGQIEGTYCAKEGKIVKAKTFCQRYRINFEQACYYGDSIADIPLLSTVPFPVVCNPGIEMQKIARKNRWPIKYF